MLDGYICIGYHLVRPVPRPQNFDPLYKPSQVLSVSSCICDLAPAEWLINWVDTSDEERAELGNKFGILAERLPEAIDWVTQAVDGGQMGWPDVVMSLESAKLFAERFVPLNQAVRLIGVGLSEQHVGAVVAATKPESPNVGESGIHVLAKRRMRLAADGQMLGHEILGTEIGGSSHSWLCNSLIGEVERVVGVVPNDLGFIESREKADAVASYINRDDVGAEPCLWIPVAIVEYSR